MPKTAPITREEAEKAAEKVWTFLHTPLEQATELTKGMEYRLGPRTLENTYLFDDIQAIIAHARSLNKSLNDLLKSTQTIR